MDVGFENPLFATIELSYEEASYKYTTTTTTTTTTTSTSNNNTILLIVIVIILLLIIVILILIMIIIRAAKRRPGLFCGTFPCKGLLGRPILYTTTTQRGWCIEAFVSILAQLQSQNSLSGGGGV